MQDFHSHSSIVPIEADSRNSSKQSSCTQSASEKICSKPPNKQHPLTSKFMRSVYPENAAAETAHLKGMVSLQKATIDSWTTSLHPDLSETESQDDRISIHMTNDSLLVRDGFTHGGKQDGPQAVSPKPASLCQRIRASIRKSISRARTPLRRPRHRPTVEDLVRAKDEQILAAISHNHYGGGARKH
jgi:hypothetical protein